MKADCQLDILIKRISMLQTKLYFSERHFKKVFFDPIELSKPLLSITPQLTP